jgi:hypothetical protein
MHLPPEGIKISSMRNTQNKDTKLSYVFDKRNVSNGLIMTLLFGATSVVMRSKSQYLAASLDLDSVEKEVISQDSYFTHYEEFNVSITLSMTFRILESNGML